MTNETTTQRPETFTVETVEFVTGRVVSTTEFAFPQFTAPRSTWTQPAPATVNFQGSVFSPQDPEVAGWQQSHEVRDGQVFFTPQQ